MRHIKQSWFYKQLAEIFGEDNLIVQATFTSNHSSTVPLLFPVKAGIETIGWVGIREEMLQEHNLKLIQILAEHQHLIYVREESSDESIWRGIIENEDPYWEEKWQKLQYSEECLFGKILLNISGTPDQINNETHSLLREIMEGFITGKSYLIPLSPLSFVWIIPNIDQLETDLYQILIELVDTLASEVMINTRFYLGSSFTMPIALKQLIVEEQRLFELAIQSKHRKKVLQFKDITHLLLLDQIPKQDMVNLVEKLIGTVKDDQELLHTIELYFKENLNISEAAKKLYIHRNSLQYRLDKFYEKTGLDVRLFEDAANVFLAIQAYSIMNKK